MRLFFALLLPDEALPMLQAVQNRLASCAQAARLTKPENLHLTLAFLGETPPEKLSQAKDALQAVGAAEMSLWTLWDVPCTYPLFERMKLEIAACGGVVRDADYGADIRLRAAFPAGGAEAFAPRLTELSAGSLEMAAAGEATDVFTGVGP